MRYESTRNEVQEYYDRLERARKRDAWVRRATIAVGFSVGAGMAVLFQLLGRCGAL